MKTGFLGLSGRQQKDKEIDYTNVKSYVGAGENIDIKADKNVTVLASDVEAGNEVNTNSYWHTSTSNDPNKGYNSNQIQNDVTGEFVVEENDNFHKTNEVEKINGKNTTSKISQKIKEFFKKSKKEGEK